MYVPIEGFPGYFAGSDGFIYSNKRWRGSTEMRRLAGGLGTNKYMNLVLMCEGKRYTRMIHVLVCAAFHGPPPPGTEVSHLDGCKTNNVPSNLRWETRSENRRRRLLHDGGDHGHLNSRALLNAEQVAEVRHLLAEGTLTHEQIGQRFGVSRAFITKINRGLRYPQKEAVQ